MKLNHSIRDKVELFTKSKYLSQFETIMTNIVNGIPTTTKKPKKKLLFNDQPKQNNSYWNEIIKSILIKESIDDSLSLSSSYLRLKAKSILPKVKQIAIIFNIKINQVIKNYFALCRKEIDMINLSKKVSFNNKAQDNSTPKQPSKVKKILKEINTNHSDDREEVKDIESNDIEIEQQPSKIISIFVGQADFKKLMNNKQKIVMQKGKYCQTFIIADVEDNNNNNSNVNNSHINNWKVPATPSNKKKTLKGSYPQPISPPLTCKNSSSKFKSFCLNQDLSMIMKNNPNNNNNNNGSKLSIKRQLSHVKLQECCNERDTSNPFAFPSITTKGKSTSISNFWKHYRIHQMNPTANVNANANLNMYINSRLIKSHSQACGLTTNSVKVKPKYHLINYMNRKDLYY